MQISQKAIIKKDDRYLILLRSPQSPVYPIHWDFPGGRLNEGETLEEGIIREVKEETTLDIVPFRIVFEYEDFLRGKTTKLKVYEVKSYVGEVVLSHEHADYQWATKEEILKLPTFSYIKPFLESLEE